MDIAMRMRTVACQLRERKFLSLRELVYEATERALVSPGRAFRQAKARERDITARQCSVSLRQSRRDRRLADTERLKALGGIDRDPEQEREWCELAMRNPERPLSYFEKRLWEKRDRAISP